MTTEYEGREDEHDLGSGHSFSWLYNSGGKLVGIIEHHPKGPNAAPGSLYCGGYVSWDTDSGMKSNHQLVAGEPGQEEHLTLSPSLLCRTCGDHGFIRDGRWVPA